MGRWTAESTGMDVLRPIACNLLKNKVMKDRVWSDSLYAWGFFADSPTQIDEFIVWCSVTPGDRIRLDHGDVCTVIGVWKEKSKNAPLWSIKMINQEGRIVSVEVAEHDLFHSARHFIGM